MFMTAYGGLLGSLGKCLSAPIRSMKLSRVRLKKKDLNNTLSNPVCIWIQGAEHLTLKVTQLNRNPALHLTLTPMVYYDTVLFIQV